MGKNGKKWETEAVNRLVAGYRGAAAGALKPQTALFRSPATGELARRGVLTIPRASAQPVKCMHRNNKRYHNLMMFCSSAGITMVQDA
jgi:hypothetical protein